MFNRKKLLSELNNKGWSRYKLSKESGIAQTTLRDIFGEKAVTPSTTTLSKISAALEVPISNFFDDIEESNQIRNENPSEQKCMSNKEFKTAEDAMQFILKQPAIMGFGGFDTNSMSDLDKIEFANDLLQQLKLISYKYKK